MDKVCWEFFEGGNGGWGLFGGRVLIDWRDTRCSCNSVCVVKFAWG